MDPDPNSIHPIDTLAKRAGFAVIKGLTVNGGGLFCEKAALVGADAVSGYVVIIHVCAEATIAVPVGLQMDSVVFRLMVTCTHFLHHITCFTLHFDIYSRRRSTRGCHAASLRVLANRRTTLLVVEKGHNQRSKKKAKRVSGTWWFCWCCRASSCRKKGPKLYSEQMERVRASLAGPTPEHPRCRKTGRRYHTRRTEHVRASLADAAAESYRCRTGGRKFYGKFRRACVVQDSLTALPNIKQNVNQSSFSSSRARQSKPLPSTSPDSMQSV